MNFDHVYLEPKYDETTTILVCHGTGGDEHSLVPFAQNLLPNAAILSVRGRVSENGANRFFRRFAEGVFDEASIRTEADALAEFLSESATKYGFESSRVVGFGYSNGANILHSMWALHGSSLWQAVLCRAMVTIENLEWPDLTGCRVFLAEGRLDPITPVENAERLSSMFKHAGAEVELYWHPGGHSLSRQELVIAADWLAATES